MFDTLWTRLIDLINQVWYPGLFIASFIENLIPPVPSEVIMPLGWYLAGTWKLSLLWVIAVCAIGSTLGNVPYYFIGKYFHKSKIKKFVSRYGKYFFTKEENVDDLYDVFEKNDRKIVFFGRFLPWARAFIGIPAWSTHMDFLQFFWYTLAGTTVWTVFLVFLWYWFGTQYDVVIGLIKEYEHIMLPLVAVLLLGVLARVFLKKRNKTKREDNIAKQEDELDVE